MSLRDEMALYTELSGNDGNHTPIGIIGAYLDGYEKGKASAQPEITKEAVELYCRQRCLTVITNELFAEMKAKWSAQPEQKKGKWIIRDNPGTGWYRVTCSECGEDVTSTIPMIGFFPNAKPLWDYCPYCGAKMEVEG